MSMTTLAVFGTVLLGMGRGTFMLPVLMLAAGVTSVYFTDISRRFRLNQTLASIAALTAAGVSMYDFFQFDRTQQLLAVANLLVYLQVVLLYQEKNERVYWQLIMTSLLQVVVAAALSLSVVFGVLLFAYMLVALVTLLLFFVYRETRRYPSGEVTTTGDSPIFTRVGPPRRPAHWGLVSATNRMVVTTLIVTVAVFVTIPRIGTSSWQTTTGSATRATGFSEQVELGELGEIAENPEVVMRVQFINEKTGKPIELLNDPLLRGSVVINYDRSDDVSRWSRGNWTYQRSSGWRGAKELPRTDGSEQYLVRQKINLEQVDRGMVFSVFPPVMLDSEVEVKYDANRQQLIRRGSRREQPSILDLGTVGIRGNYQFTLTPQDQQLSTHDEDRLLQMPYDDDGNSLLPGLQAAAVEALDVAQTGEADRSTRARLLSRFLRYNPRFTYSLASVERDPTIDPIEDFIVNNPTGHCEYFASALALMLRSQEIPARVVIGYRAGEWNPISKSYVIRHLHAHTWVEAYISPEELASQDLDFPEGQPYGGWLRLDPTPSPDDDGDDAVTGIIAQFGQLVDYFEMLWVAYVIGLDAEKQQEAIFLPFARTATTTSELLRSDSLRLELRLAFGGISDRFWNWFGGDWFSWRGGLVASAIAFFLFIIFEATRLTSRRVRHWRMLRFHAAHGGAAMVPFFINFQRMLRRHGITRAPGQTPRELATSVGGQLAESAHSRGAADLPRHIVEAFYRVRFGRRPLDNHEAKTVEHALAELNTALGRGSR